jgi:hypothetical protein
MTAKIYQPAKSAMQSGQGPTRSWRLELTAEQAPLTDPLMGWTGGGGSSGVKRLNFASKEQAIAFAQVHGIPYEVVEFPAGRRVIKAYGDNFSFRRREPWSH